MLESNSFPKGQKGFGLTEVIVSMLVLGIAVIGFAALQIRALDTTSDAMFRTQAMALAQDLGERMMLNPDPTASAVYRGVWSPATMPNYKCETTACTPAEMAQYDMKTMDELVKASLPNGQIALIKCINRNNYCVYVAWNKTTATQGSAAPHCSTNQDAFVAEADCVKLETSLL
ncbi:MAG TPA: type IV pilus modification protein PilV [Agitococcus sp.]|jgi:type IV pilus assembly protein PilV|nr:type IV pilus modification protein PilV [Agitococcus sp.]